MPKYIEIPAWFKFLGHFLLPDSGIQSFFKAKHPCHLYLKFKTPYCH